MDVERIGPSGQASPSEKKEKKSTPDTEEFREMMKVGETELEQSKKRKLQKEQKEKSKLPSKTKEPPTVTTPLKPSPKLNLPKNGGEVQPQKQTTQEPKPQDIDREKKAEEKKEKKKKEEIVTYKEEMKKEQLQEKEKKIEKEDKTKKIIAKKEKLKTEAPKEEKELITPKEKKLITPKEKKFEKEKKKEKEEFKHEISSVIQEMPTNIANQTQMLTSSLTPYLHPDIIPLFEKMVGTIIQIQSQGITSTQVILNSPAFTSSIFFGCSIVLEKYSTAPDSFNIFLRGPQQAVVMFNENLEGLLDAFKKGNFHFKIGRLEAEHEKPLFKRKEKPSEKDTDTGSKR